MPIALVSVPLGSSIVVYADQLNTPERTQGKQDLAVSSSAKQAAQLLQAATPALSAPESKAGEHAWVY
jgi:hypothetical protein